MRPANKFPTDLRLILSNQKNQIPERPLPGKTPFLVKKLYGLDWSQRRQTPQDHKQLHLTLMANTTPFNPSYPLTQLPK